MSLPGGSPANGLWEVSIFKLVYFLIFPSANEAAKLWLIGEELAVTIPNWDNKFYVQYYFDGWKQIKSVHFIHMHMLTIQNKVSKCVHSRPILSIITKIPFILLCSYKYTCRYVITFILWKMSSNRKNMPPNNTTTIFWLL